MAALAAIGAWNCQNHSITHTHTHTHIHTHTHTHILTQTHTQNTPIAHSRLSDVLDPVMELFEDVKRKCLMRLEYENQMKCEAITSPSSKFYQKPFDYAMWKYAYYVCYKCKKVR